MMKRLAILLAFAALTAVASASLGRQGGYDHPGRISQIMCFEDQYGYLAGIGYLNEYTGYESYCTAPHGGYFGAGCSTGCKNDLILNPLESIIKVEACRGGKYGYTSITFVTDLGQTLTCGHGDYNYTPTDYASFGHTYQAGHYDRQSSRSLLENEAGAELDGYHRRGYGWGWSSKCQVYEAPKRPAWDGVADWYVGGNYSYAQDGRYKGAYQPYDSYYQYESAGSKGYYYKDYNRYKNEQQHCNNCSCCDHQANYYYSQVYPLASFKAKCDRNGNVYDIYKFVWNKAYVPPQPLNVLPVRFAIELDSSVNCADAQVETVLANFTAAVEALADAFPQVISDIAIYNQSVKCIPTSAANNATITIDAAIWAVDGVAVEELVAALAATDIIDSADLCTVNGITCPTPIVNSVILNYLYSDYKHLHAKLLDRQFRTKLAKYTVVVSNPNPALSA